MILFAVVATILFGLLVEKEPAISDSIGYLYAGKRLASGNGLSYEDPNNAIAGPYFVPYAFQVSRKGDQLHYLGFPPGFPLLLAFGELLGLIHFVVPFLSGLTIIFTYVLGKELSGNSLTGFLAAIILVSASAFWQFGTAAWSEVPATLAVSAGVVFYLRSHQPGYRGLAYSFLAAVILTFGHFIRYTNVVFLGALLVYEVYTVRGALLHDRRRWVFWGAAAVGVLTIPLFNHFYYGGALITSYSSLHGWYPWSPFSLAYALGPSFVNGFSLLESIKTLWKNFPLILLLAPGGWWLLPPRGRVLVGSIFLFGLAPYVVYAFAPEGVNSRFLLPIFPFISVTVANLLANIPRWLQRPSLGWALSLVGVMGFLYLIPGNWETLTARNNSSRGAIALAESIVAGTEPNAVFLSYTYNDMITLYHNRSVLNYRRIPASDKELERYRTEMLEPCLTGSISRLLSNNIPVYYVEDQKPSYWKSLEIIQRHFILNKLDGDPAVYRITERTGNTLLDESSCGFPD